MQVQQPQHNSIDKTKLYLLSGIIQMLCEYIFNQFDRKLISDSCIDL